MKTQIVLSLKTWLALRRCSRMARSLETLVHDFERRDRRLSSAAPFDDYAVMEARSELKQLAAQLRNISAPEPRGVALAKHLLTDYRSPLYDGRRGHGLREAARRATVALGQ
jgi:hypothetical protein